MQGAWVALQVQYSRQHKSLSADPFLRITGGKFSRPYILKRLDLISRTVGKYLSLTTKGVSPLMIEYQGPRSSGHLYTHGTLPRVKDDWLMDASLSELSVQPVAHSSNIVFPL